MKIEEKHTQWEWYKAVWEKLGKNNFLKNMCFGRSMCGTLWETRDNNLATTVLNYWHSSFCCLKLGVILNEIFERLKVQFSLA